ncbi:MAG: hypothetical protein AAB316_15090, partial [Bacteroidota bacterium]
FYKYLVLGNDVAAAFEKARQDAALLNRDIQLGATRGISRFKMEEATEEDFDWGLFEKEDAKPWLLPVKPYALQAAQKVEHGKFLSNLLRALKNYRSPLSDAYLDTIETIDQSGEVSDETKFTDMLRILPYPIGIRLRQIYAPNVKTEENEEQYYRELLHDYACFFETLLHYSFAMLVSQLWQNRSLISAETVAEDFTLVRQFICSNRLRGDLEAYAPAIKSAHRMIAAEPAIKHPIPRLADVLDWLGGGEFRAVCHFFDLQKDFFRSKIRLTPEEAVRQCYQSQRLLERAFHHFGFVIENVLASIRHVNVINFRHVKTEFASEIWHLLASQDGVVRPKRFDKPLENKSVLCFSDKNINTETALTSLNLFPFYLDRSAFSRQTGNVVDLYQFAGYFHDDWVGKLSVHPVERPCFYFMSLQNPDRIWRFDEMDVANAGIAHIDEPADEKMRQSQMLAVAGELNNYFEQFKAFLQL